MPPIGQTARVECPFDLAVDATAAFLDGRRASTFFAREARDGVTTFRIVVTGCDATVGDDGANGRASSTFAGLLSIRHANGSVDITLRGSCAVARSGLEDGPPVGVPQCDTASVVHALLCEIACFVQTEALHRSHDRGNVISLDRRRRSLASLRYGEPTDSV